MDTFMFRFMGHDKQWSAIYGCEVSVEFVEDHM
jgi:hypothetical protein